MFLAFLTSSGNLDRKFRADNGWVIFLVWAHQSLILWTRLSYEEYSDLFFLDSIRLPALNLYIDVKGPSVKTFKKYAWKQVTTEIPKGFCYDGRNALIQQVFSWPLCENPLPLGLMKKYVCHRFNFSKYSSRISGRFCTGLKSW